MEEERLTQTTPAILRIITGAPGSGKSTAMERFLRRGSGYVAFDMDWLLVSASALAQRDVQNDPDTWPAYNALWLEIIHAVYRNGVTPVLFAPRVRPTCPTRPCRHGLRV